MYTMKYCNVFPNQSTGEWHTQWGKKSRTERKITRGMRKEEGHRRETLMRNRVGKWDTQLCDFTGYQISHEDTEQWKKDQRLAIKTASERCLDSQKQPCSPESTIASVGCLRFILSSTQWVPKGNCRCKRYAGLLPVGMLRSSSGWLNWRQFQTDSDKRKGVPDATYSLVGCFTLLVGMQTSSACVAVCMEGSQRSNNRFTTTPHQKKKKNQTNLQVNSTSQRHMTNNVYCSITHNSCIMESTEISSYRVML